MCYLAPYRLCFQFQNAHSAHAFGMSSQGRRTLDFAHQGPASADMNVVILNTTGSDRKFYVLEILPRN